MAFAQAEPRKAPLDEGCLHGRPVPASAAPVPDLAAELGGRGTRKAWTRLLRRGPAGCTAIVDWLEAGAPGARGEGLAEVVGRVTRSAGPGLLPRLAGQYGRLGADGDAALLDGLSARLALLSEDVADLVAREIRPAVRPASICLLLGAHVVTEQVVLNGEPVTRRRDRWFAEEPLNETHRRALDAQLATPSRPVREQLVACLGAHAESARPGPQGAYDLLVPLVTLAPRSDLPLAQEAARALGLSQAPAAAEALRHMMENDDRDNDALSWFLDGLELRLRRGQGNGATLALLDKASAAQGAPGKRAATLRRRWADRVEQGTR